MSTKSPTWSKKDIPFLKGKIAIVTGATGGLGYETALGLIEAGATVVVAGRNEVKGQTVVEKLKLVRPKATVSFGKIDLCSLDSIKQFADDFNSKNQPLDILVNNAGLYQPNTRSTTADGFELLIGTNHLAHFALTGRLLPSFKRSANPRMVIVSGLTARMAKMNFDDFQSEKKFNYMAVAGQTKLANLLFVRELQRRSDESGWGICAVAAHPGLARTDLLDKVEGFYGWLSNKLKNFMGQSAADGALPQLYAATSPEVQPGGFYGPQGFYELYGPVGPAYLPPAAKDDEVAKKLWEISESLTGVTWSLTSH